MSSHRSFTENAIALYAVQGLQYLTPLLVLPVLTRNLGTDGFGELMFWQAFANGLGLITEYGFNYSAVRAISNAHGAAEIGRIFRATLAARAALLIPAAGVALLAPLAFFGKHADPAFEALLLLHLVGTAMSPAWYLAGLKRNREIAFASTAGAICMVVATIALVRTPGDIYIAAAIQFLQAPLIALVAHALVFSLAKPEPARIDGREVLRTIRHGTPLFMMTATAGIYSTINPFLMGLATTGEQVAFYSIGEKMARAARNALNPLMATLFPFASSRGAKPAHRELVSRVSLLLVLGASLLSAILVAFASHLVKLVAGQAFQPAVATCRVLALNVALITIGNVSGIQNLVARGEDRVVMAVTAISAAIHVPCFVLAARYGGALGGASTYVAIEALVAIALASLAWRSARSRPECS